MNVAESLVNKLEGIRRAQARHNGLSDVQWDAVLALAARHGMLANCYGRQILLRFDDGVPSMCYEVAYTFDCRRPLECRLDCWAIGRELAAIVAK